VYAQLPDALRSIDPGVVGKISKIATKRLAFSTPASSQVQSFGGNQPNTAAVFLIKNFGAQNARTGSSGDSGEDQCARTREIPEALVIAFPPPPVSGIVMRRYKLFIQDRGNAVSITATQAFAMMVKAKKRPVWRIIYDLSPRTSRTVARRRSRPKRKAWMSAEQHLRHAPDLSRIDIRKHLTLFGDLSRYSSG